MRILSVCAKDVEGVEPARRNNFEVDGAPMLRAWGWTSKEDVGTGCHSDRAAMGRGIRWKAVRYGGLLSIQQVSMDD